MKKKIVALCLCVALAVVAIGGATLAYFTDTAEKANTFTVGNVKIDLTEEKWDADASTKTLVPGKIYEKDPVITVADGSMDSYLVLDVSINKYSSLFWVMAADASADANIDFTIFDANGNLLDAYKNTSGVFSTTKFLNAMSANKTVFQAIVNKWFQGIEHTDWETIGVYFGDSAVKTNCYTIRLGYQGGAKNGIVKAGDNVQFMTKFGMPGSVTQEMIDAGKTVGGMQNTFNSDKADFHIYFNAYAIQAEGFTSASNAFNNAFGEGYKID